jgi:hypothetical protein
MNYQDKPSKAPSENKRKLFPSSSIDKLQEVVPMTASKHAPATTTTAKVYCPMCTHTVDATVELDSKRSHVKRGQRCPRCSGSLDAGYIMYLQRAA